MAGLTVEFDTAQGASPAVNDVTFDVFPGETLAIVGGSGFGKAMTEFPRRGKAVARRQPVVLHLISH